MEFIQFTFVLVAALCAIYYSGQGPHLMRRLNELVTGKKGCSPVADLDFVTLHYFAGRGRGEAIRLMLEEAGIPYNQTDFTMETWPQAKKAGIKSGIYTFGQVPAMVTPSGLHMVQSQAMAHYIGRATGMECDCEQLHHCEVIALGTEDFRSKLSKIIYDPGFSVKMRDEYLQSTAPMWLEHFEKLAPSIQAEDVAYFGGKHITWVDFLVFDLLDVNMEFGQVDLGRPQVAILSNYPKLQSFYNQFRTRPRIAAYLNSSKRAPYKLPYVPTVKKQEIA
ncbi:glutathione S-transferase P-like [Acanthaster planci]|uniref:Glutathione S-transferase P-like n=1 Tax=Acanthaster planci TaxID=133434 RepID=A0A8B7Y494_ACAPL|nr:glutathione S-transferase P-like [Acanthaster planci]